MGIVIQEEPLETAYIKNWYTILENLNTFSRLISGFKLCFLEAGFQGSASGATGIPFECEQLQFMFLKSAFQAKFCCKNWFY